VTAPQNHPAGAPESIPGGDSAGAPEGSTHEASQGRKAKTSPGQARRSRKRSVQPPSPPGERPPAAQPAAQPAAERAVQPPPTGGERAAQEIPPDALGQYAEVLTTEERREALLWREGSLKLDISVFRVHLKRMLRLASGIQTMGEMIRFMNAYGTSLLRISHLLAEEARRGLSSNQLNGEINKILKEILEVMENEQEQNLNGTRNGV
jgi:hypothetical protein